MLSRRNLLVAAGAGVLPASLLADSEAARPLRILVLGGSRFIGRHIVQYARQRGHALALFNRGKSEPAGTPGVEQLRGDRGTDLTALRDRAWDAVIDTSGYVPRQVRESANLLAPGAPSGPLQFVDVRDLARFCIDCLERSTFGIFNAVHAPGSVTMGGVLDASRRLTGADTRFTWVDAAFLAGRPERDKLPMWSPPQGDTTADHLTRNERAVRAGLTTTPLDTTIRDTLAWHAKRPAPEREKLADGLTPQAERALLDAWRVRLSPEA